MTSPRNPRGSVAGTPATPLAKLRREVAARGWYDPPTGRMVGELAVGVVLALGGMLTFLVCTHPGARALALIVSTVASMAVATKAHTASHYATSRTAWVNEALTYLGVPLFLGLSATYWWHKHVTQHHRGPNVRGVDHDMELMPWFAITTEEVARSRGAWRTYYRHVQWLVFPFALFLNGFNMQRNGVRHVLAALRDPATRRAAHWIDVGALALHVVVFVGAPLLVFPAADVGLLYVLRIGTFGYGMFFVFGPGHLPADAASVAREHVSADAILVQTAATLNFRTGPIGRFVCSGLEYQIEHHLFPNVSHVHYPALSGHVREFCRTNGYPYRSFSWPGGVWRALDVLRNPKDCARPPLPASIESRGTP